jgi:wobble nucleotide-excising tRNase
MLPIISKKCNCLELELTNDEKVENIHAWIKEINETLIGFT